MVTVSAKYSNRCNPDLRQILGSEGPTVVASPRHRVVRILAGTASAEALAGKGGRGGVILDRATSPGSERTLRDGETASRPRSCYADA